jgi:transcription elongation factor GreB
MRATTRAEWHDRIVSKAFTKDDDDAEPLVVPPRRPLPKGATNYVTPHGLDALRGELHVLEAERARLEGKDGDPDHAHAIAVLHTRIHELAERIASAVLVDPKTQPQGEVRFGAHITVRDEEGDDREYDIVGVDEADAAHGRVAFVAPIARALLGKHVGEVATLRTPRGEEEIEIIAIAYDGANSH